MNPVIQIIAGHSVRFSMNNGISTSEFDDAEFYQVPPHVASGMVARGWAKIVSPHLADQPRQPPEVKDVSSSPDAEEVSGYRSKKGRKL